MFWRNYFYRVFLIKQSSQLASLASAEAHSEEGMGEGGEGVTATSEDSHQQEARDEKLQGIFQEDSTLQVYNNNYVNTPFALIETPDYSPWFSTNFFLI